MYLYFIRIQGLIIFHCIDIPQFVYPFMGSLAIWVIFQFSAIMIKVTMTILGEHNLYIVEYMNILENFMWTYIFMGVSFEPSTKRLRAQQGKGEGEEGRKVYLGRMSATVQAPYPCHVRMLAAHRASHGHICNTHTHS